MISIGNRKIGPKEPPYFIADLASNHDGDLERAFRLIELAKENGADAAKFQNFNASTIVSKGGFSSLGKRLSHQSSWKKSVYEVYEDCSIKDDWTRQLKEKCDEVGIEYMTSPYDFEAVELAEPYVQAYKIGSGDITWIQILDYIARKNKPVILATGASSLEDVDRAVKTILPVNKDLILLQCNTNYTASVENYKYVNLNVLKTFASLYPDIILGLSDHTPGHVTVLGAIALGAQVIEKHFTDDNDRNGPDHRFSLNPGAWKEMVKRSMDLWFALGDGIKKVEANESEAAIIQRRSLYFTKDLKASTILKQEDLFPLRPINVGGIPPYQLEQLIGKQLTKAVTADTCIKWEDISVNSLAKECEPKVLYAISEFVPAAQSLQALMKGMVINMKRGEKVYLSAIEREDLTLLMKWRNIEDFKKHFREYLEINTELQDKWYQNKVLNDPTTIMFSIKRVDDDELLGCCGLCYINWVHRHADLSLYIGYHEEYIDKDGYASESCKLLFDYGYNQLGLNKIWTEIYEFDLKKKELFDSIGFKVDGILRQNYYYEGRWWNSYLLSLLREEFIYAV
ncbi:MAG: GNAT family N-acetyltransferase [Herbinix sp.]|nr:GNAT family N-acetyltransferase [Herbinix sp.]